MTIKAGENWSGLFLTLDATGALKSGSPSGTLYIDGNSTGDVVTITGSNPYKFEVTLPSGSSLTPGQRADIYVTATIDSISTAGIVASSQADTLLNSDIWSYENRTLTSASSVLDVVVEGTYTLQDIFKIIGSVLAGKSTGGGTTEVTFRDLSDTLDRISATVDANGNRSSVIITED